jgi:hypothetical protein
MKKKDGAARNAVRSSVFTIRNVFIVSARGVRIKIGDAPHICSFEFE